MTGFRTAFEMFLAYHIFVFGPEGATYYDGDPVQWNATFAIIKSILAVAILFLIVSIIIIVRQRKIMKMLRDLTPPKAEPPKEEDTVAKETE